MEATAFREDFAAYKKLNAQILGVSPDDVDSHAKWRQKLKIPHPLLADTEHAVAQRYGVWVQKSMMGKSYWGVARTTLIVDEQGKVAKMFPNVKVQGHSAEVLAALREMASATKS